MKKYFLINRYGEYLIVDNDENKVHLDTTTDVAKASSYNTKFDAFLEGYRIKCILTPEEIECNEDDKPVEIKKVKVKLPHKNKHKERKI